jgi:methyl-accepting chemotaxis protein
MELPTGSITAFISPDGKEITNTDTTDEAVFYGQQFYNEVLAGDDNNYNTNMDYKGSKYLFICSKVGTSGAAVAALVPYSEITYRAASIKVTSVVIILFAVVIAGLIGILVAQSISRNIKIMIDTLSKAADGDLTVSVKTKRQDEFKVLSESINHMISNVKQLITKASSVGNTVYDSSRNVTQNSELLLTESKDISTAIAEIQQGMTQQASDAEQCLQQSDALADRIRLVYDNSVAIEKITENTKSVVTDGIKEVDELNEAAKANIEITNDTIRNMEELADESKAITEIISVINDISEQTNLLSLNASIEAARAGEAGRGFSVVAEEIRKLSVKTVNSASEIEKIIHNINKKTQLTVQTVKEAGTISNTTESRLKNVIQLFNNINVHVDHLAEKMANIAEGINDINKAKNDTLKAVESISAVAQETSASSQEVDAAAQQQLEAVMKLNDAAKSLSQEASELSAAILQFRIN